MRHKHGQWYIRKQGKISGPFTASVISNHLKVGRLASDDEVSRDRRHWHTFADSDDFTVPQQKASPIKGYLDERTGEDRRNTPPTEVDETILQQRKGERREEEADVALKRRALRRTLMHRHRNRHQKILWPSLIILIILSVVASLAFFYPTKLPTPQSDCQSPAAPNVNWNNCQLSGQLLTNADLSMAQMRGSILTDSNMMNSQLSGADLAYSDLRKANLSYSQLNNADLKGANLREADLVEADLSNADLSYADLTNANISGAITLTTKLDNAIWIDGTVCGKNSTGVCRRSVQ